MPTIEAKHYEQAIAEVKQIYHGHTDLLRILARISSRAKELAAEQDKEK